MGLYRKEKSFWSEQARPSLVEQGSRNRGRGGFWQIRQSYLSQRGRLFSPLYYLPPTPTDFQTFLRRCRAPTNQAYHAIAVLTIFVPSKDGLLVPGDSWLLPFFKQWNQSLFRVVCEFNILNTQYMTNSILVSPVKMEYGWNFRNSVLKMMMKSGLEKYFWNSSMRSPCPF